MPIVRIRPHKPEGRGMKTVPAFEGYALPSRFTAEVDDPELPVLVELEVVTPWGGPPQLDSVQCRRRPGGGDLTGAALRQVTVATYLRLAIERAARPFEIHESPEFVLRTESEERRKEWEDLGPHPGERLLLVGTIRDGEQAEDLYSEVRRLDRRRRTPLSRDDLADAAKVYRTALKAGDNPTAKVAEVLYLSRSSAGRWVAEARSRGLLGPTRERRAGETDVKGKGEA